MKKETKKQIKGQVINEVSRRYKTQLLEVEEREKKWRKCWIDACGTIEKFRKHNEELKEENDSLKGKIKQYEEWIERMQEYCNLPDGERESAFKTYLDGIKAKKESAEVLSRLGKMYSTIFGSHLF